MLKVQTSVSIGVTYDFRAIYQQWRTSIEYKLRQIEMTNKQMSRLIQLTQLNWGRSEINCVYLNTMPKLELVIVGISYEEN